MYTLFACYFETEINCEPEPEPEPEPRPPIQKLFKTEKNRFNTKRL